MPTRTVHFAERRYPLRQRRARSRKSLALKSLAKCHSKDDSKIYARYQGIEKRLITLISEEDTFYSIEQAKPDYSKLYSANSFRPHPLLVRTYPTIWREDVAIAVMDYMDGQTLANWIRKVGPLDLADAVKIVLDSLQVARFLKDDRESGRSTRAQSKSAKRRLQSDGFMRGPFFTFFHTPWHLKRAEDQDARQRLTMDRCSEHNYSSPEQFMHRPKAHQLNSQQICTQNIYCLGALLFELLADHMVPNYTYGMQLIKNLEFVSAHELRKDAPIELSKILQRMMEFNPEKRYQRYDDVYRSLGVTQHCFGELFLHSSQ